VAGVCRDAFISRTRTDDTAIEAANGCQEGCVDLAGQHASCDGHRGEHESELADLPEPDGQLARVGRQARDAREAEDHGGFRDRH
jgi:hypothetical protein